MTQWVPLARTGHTQQYTHRIDTAIYTQDIHSNIHTGHTQQYTHRIDTAIYTQDIHSNIHTG